MAELLNLRSSLRKRLLGYLFTNERAEHYVRELAKILEVDPTNLSRELSRLEDQGLVISSRRGSQKYYRLQRLYPLYREIKRLVQSSVGVVPHLREKLKAIAKIDAAYLYGSFAKGEQDRFSDVDLLIVGNPRHPDLENALRPLERRLGRQINYTLIARSELDERLKHADPFLSDVWRGKKIDLLA